LRRNIPPIRRLSFNKLHGVIAQKIELLIATHFCENLRSCNCENDCRIKGANPWSTVLLGRRVVVNFVIKFSAFEEILIFIVV
jgi:hypothetical protein